MRHHSPSDQLQHNEERDKQLFLCTVIGTIIEIVLRKTEDKPKRKMLSATWEEALVSGNIAQRVWQWIFDFNDGYALVIQRWLRTKHKCFQQNRKKWLKRKGIEGRMLNATKISWQNGKNSVHYLCHPVIVFLCYFLINTPCLIS